MWPLPVRTYACMHAWVPSKCVFIFPATRHVGSPPPFSPSPHHTCTQPPKPHKNRCHAPPGGSHHGLELRHRAQRGRDDGNGPGTPAGSHGLEVGRQVACERLSPGGRGGGWGAGVVFKIRQNWAAPICRANGCGQNCAVPPPHTPPHTPMQPGERGCLLNVLGMSLVTTIMMIAKWNSKAAHSSYAELSRGPHDRQQLQYFIVYCLCMCASSPVCGLLIYSR
jgi:hypothetical protein